MNTRQLRLIYGLAIAVLGAACLAWAAPAAPAGNPAWVLLAFLAWTVFALVSGFSLSAYASLDRCAHVAAILVIGPYAAAVVNAVASFIFPFVSRDYNRGRYDFALARGLHNAGMFAIVVIGGAGAYAWAGGRTPLATLRPGDGWAILVMGVVMQALNAAMIALRTWVERGDMSTAKLSSSDLLDIGTVPIGVLAAILINRLEGPVIALFVALLVMLVVVVNRLARSRAELLRRNEDLEVTAQKDRLFIELQRRTLELQRESAEDSLTGLANRRELDRHLGAEIARAEQTGSTLSVAIADIDHFKQINDTYGHAVGDRVLQAAARILRGHCRDMDMVARYGGEEFALSLPQTDAGGARVLCERIRAAFATADWALIVPGLRVTVSIGVADFTPGAVSTELFDRADENLYRAKRQGRNRVVG